MDRGFNFMALLQMDNHENKHKIKPTQFVSVAGGVKKRLENNINSRKSTRLTSFDNFRRIPKPDTPAKQPLNKVEQRLLQLQKWKEEKEKKKREAITQKKKPFVAGVGRIPLKLVSPPKPSTSSTMPSTSGRVTRSQAARTNVTNIAKQSKPDKKQIISVQSFAPKNATFNPELKKLDKPILQKIREKDVQDNLTQKENKTVKNNNMKKHNMKSVQKPEVHKLRSRTKASETNSKVKQTHQKIPHNCSTASSSSNTETEDKPPLVNDKPQRKSKQITKAKRKPSISSSYNNNSSSCTETHDVEIFVKQKGSNVKNNVNKKKTLKPIEPTKTLSENGRNVSLTNSRSTNNYIDNQSNATKDNSPNKSIQDTNGALNNTIDDLITFTPNNRVPRSESSSEEKLRSPKSVYMTPHNIVEEARKISPRVCLSRGKDNARKEIRKRIDEGLLDDDVCDMSIEHFRRQLDSEIKRMTEMCDTWDKISEHITLPDEIQEAVLSATGQARLLMSQKLQQFATLLRRCERPEPGTALVTHHDLQGFWDMVFMQVENVDMRFKKLEECRARGWVEEQPAMQRNTPRPKPPARNARPAATSRLKDIIAAARRAKKEQLPDDVQKERETKTFEAGFFSVQSPVKSPALSTPIRKHSLLKTVLSSEAKKASANSSSYAMLRASTIGKTVENEEEMYNENVSALAPIDLGVTPGRSILKPNNNISAKKSGKKSIKMVLFESSDAESSPEVLAQTNKLDDISGVEELINTSVETEADRAADGKENRRSSRRANLVRQEAIENNSPVRTRSKTVQTPNSGKVQNQNVRRSSRRTLRKSIEVVNVVETPNVSTRSKRKTML